MKIKSVATAVVPVPLRSDWGRSRSRGYNRFLPTGAASCYWAHLNTSLVAVLMCRLLFPKLSGEAQLYGKRGRHLDAHTDSLY